MWAHAAAFWPVWRWYFDRMNDGGDEPWALAALAAAIFASWPGKGLRIVAFDRLPTTPAALTLLYAVSAPFAPPLIRALLATSALACTWTSIAGARERIPAILVLLVLSLPVLASLQFYAGYPLRVITAAGATQALDAVGWPVMRAGTSMSMDGRMVLVDAPCSGVRMWWTACVLCCLLAAQRSRLTMAGLGFSLLLALPVVLFVNTVRATALFVLETGVVESPSWAHGVIGAASFSLAALLLLASEALQNRGRGNVPAPRSMAPA
mgnify:CR=1 FL=1